MLAASILVWKLQPPPTSDGRVVLTWVTDDNPARKGQAALYEKLHPNIKINIDPVNGGVEKVIVQCLAGVGPDVFDAFDAFQLAAYVKSGVALDVTDRLQKDGIELNKDAFPGVLGTSVYGGRTYGVPTNIAADGIWYHKDLLREAGVGLPRGAWTWQQLIPIAQRLTKRGPEGRITQYGLMFEWWNWRHFFTIFGAHVFNPSGTMCDTDSPKAIAAIQMMVDLVYKYHVSPTPVEESSMATQGGFGSGYISLLAAKRGAMAVGGRWWLGELRSVKGLELGVVESPTEKVHASHAYGRGMLVNKHSDHLRESLAFQEYLSSDAYLSLVNDQADGAGAFVRADETSKFLFNPQHPSEKSNDVWLRIMKMGVGDEVSPFVDSSTVARLIQVQIDLVQTGQKSPSIAMKDASKNINDAIQKSISEDPGLAEKFEAANRNQPL